MTNHEDRGNWPRWYGRCRLDDGARAGLARWAFYNIGAFMCSRTPGPHLEPRRLAALEAPDHFRECSRCGQTVISRAADPVCETCRKLDRAPQGDALQLFTPAPAGITGQLSF